MAITSLPGATAACVAWRRPGQLCVTAVVKATFYLVPDGPMIATVPEPIFRDEQAPESGVGLRSAGDLAPYLGQTDVCLTGHATIPANSTRAAVRLGVFCNGLPQVDTWVELETSPKGVRREARVRIAGLGPISKSWPVRRRLLEGCDPNRLEGPILDIPATFDWSYFQAAPLNQQMARLRGDEWIGMVGIFAERPRLMTRLPNGAQGVARLYGQAADLCAGRPIQLIADALHIDVDRRTCSITWRGNFPIAMETDFTSMHIVAGVELPGQRLDWFNPFEQAARTPMPAIRFPQPSADGAPEHLLCDETETLVPGLMPVMSMLLPFQPASLLEPPRSTEQNAFMTADLESTDDWTSTLVPDLRATTRGAAPTLPFTLPTLPLFVAQPPAVPASARVTAPQPTPEPFEPTEAGTETLVPWLMPTSSAPMPFQPVPALEPRHPLTVQLPPEENADDWTSTLVPAQLCTDADATPALPFAPPSTGALAALRVVVWQPTAAPVALTDDGTETLVPGFLAAGSAPLPFRSEPPIEPLRRPFSSPVTMLETPVANDPPATIQAKLLAVQVYASIKAALWDAAASSAARIVAAYGVTEVEWLTHELRYANALAEEARRGRTELALTVSSAILAARAQRLDPIPDISIDDFVALCIACETAADPTVPLSARGLTSAAFRILKSRWQTRASADAAFGTELRVRLTAARVAEVPAHLLEGKHGTIASHR